MAHAGDFAPSSTAMPPPLPRHAATPPDRGVGGCPGKDVGFLVMRKRGWEWGWKQEASARGSSRRHRAHEGRCRMLLAGLRNEPGHGCGAAGARGAVSAGATCPRPGSVPCLSPSPTT